MPYITNAYSLEDVGKYIFSVAAVSFSFLIFDFGMSTFGIKKVADLKGDTVAVSRLLGVCSVLKLALLGFVSVVLIILYYFLEELTYIYIYAISLVAIVSQSFIPYWLFQSIDKVRYVAIINLLSRCLNLFIAIIIMKMGLSIQFVILAGGCAWMISALFSYSKLRRLGYSMFSRVFIVDVRQYFAESYQFYFARLCSSVYLYANVFILSMFSAVALALYGVAEYFYKLTQAVVQAFNQALYPFLTKNPSFRALIYVILILALPLIVTFVLFSSFSDVIILSLYGESYLGVIPYVQSFICLAFVNMLNIMFGYPASAIVKDYVHVNNSTYFGLGVYFLCVFILYLFGADIGEPIRLIYALLLTEFCMFLYRLTFFLKNFKSNRTLGKQK